MNNKHTLGPWRVKDVQPDAFTRQIWTCESHGSVMIATTGGIDKDDNAHLIAAAPDLLAACENALDRFDGAKECEGPLADRACRLLREAIAKATGK